jgi:ankyrin repeat protein
MSDSEDVPSTTLGMDLMQGVASLLHSHSCADLSLQTHGGDLTVPVHTLVLSCRCPQLLQEVVQVTDRAGALPVSALPAGISAATTEAMLEYAYRDTLRGTLSEAELREVYLCCGRFGLARLAYLCEQRLQALLTAVSAPRLLQLALSIGSDRLSRAAEKFIRANFDAVAATPGFANLPPKLGASLFATRHARPLVQAVRCASASAAVIEELFHSTGGLDSLELCTTAVSSAAIDGGGAGSGSGSDDDEAARCSALEAALWCNPAASARWDIAQLLLRLSAAASPSPDAGSGLGSGLLPDPLGMQRLVASGLLPGASVMHSAVAHVRPPSALEELLRWLVTRGADPNLLDAHGCTPLDCAGWAAAPRSTLGCLVEIGGRAKGTNKAGDTLLHWAVRARDLEFCRTLIQLGSELSAVNLKGESPLMLAVCALGDPELAELLLEHGAFASDGLTGGIALGNLAVTADHTGRHADAAKFYVWAARGLRTAIVSLPPDTAYQAHYAKVATQYEDRARYLRREATEAPAEALAEAPAVSEVPIPMMHNVKATAPVATSALAPHAPMTTRGEGLLRGLCAAATVPPATRVWLAELLLSKWGSAEQLEVEDADPTDGSTIIHLLVAIGALPLAPSTPSMSASTAAGASALTAAPAADGAAAPEVDPAASRSAAAATVRLLGLLIEAGASVNAMSHKSNTPLHVACATSVRLPVIELLVHARADVNAMNARKETPLHLLAVSSSFESTQASSLLIRSGAKLGARDARLETPLHKAVICGNLSLACELVRAGSSLNVLNGTRQTALDIVALQGMAQRERLLEAITTPPLWVPDELSIACMLCRTAFTARKRRHHCRHCGCTVCHECSPHKSTIAKFSMLKPVRCCILCTPLVASAEPLLLPAAGGVGSGGGRGVASGGGAGSYAVASDSFASPPGTTPPRGTSTQAPKPAPLLSAALLLGEDEADSPEQSTQGQGGLQQQWAAHTTAGSGTAGGDDGGWNEQPAMLWRETTWRETTDDE